MEVRDAGRKGRAYSILEFLYPLELDISTNALGMVIKLASVFLKSD